MMLSLDDEFVIKSPMALAPLPSKVKRTIETYPVFRDPKSGEMYTCIFWAADQLSGYEYYGFEKAKGSFRNKKSLVYRGFKMEETSFMSEFPRSMFDSERYVIFESPQDLGEKVLPPQYRILGKDDSQKWQLVDVPFI